MKSRSLLLVGLLLTLAATAGAASFVVPDDEQMLGKSAAVLIGTVEGSYVQTSGDEIETVYEIRVERALKGDVRANELVRVVSPGGFTADRGVVVDGAAHFEQGERTLVFLLNENGQWKPTDMLLGKFRFRVTTAGERVLVRGREDVVGWDHAMRPHRERIRREGRFLRFLDERLAGRAGTKDYFVDSSEVTLRPQAEATPGPVQSNATAFPPKTYTDNVSGGGGTYRGTRRPNMPAGVPFYKRADQNALNTADGGVSIIQNALNAWTAECGSAINLSYAGTTATASANFDGVNVVEFNDPQGRVAGSWGGGGTIAITFNSFSSTHTFAGETWWSISDADVVFQNGFPGNHAAMPTGMTHEVGHGIGWRHSNAHHIRSTGADSPCNAAVEECSNSAIMYFSSSAAFGYTLQPWDINAAQSVYPGGTCGPACVVPTITVQPRSQTAQQGSTVTLSVTATGTGPFTYQWYQGTSGNTSTPVNGANGSILPAIASSTISYWVRVMNACGTANSTTATITVTTPAPTGPARGDLNGDGRPDLVWRHIGNGTNYVWFMNGAVQTGGSYLTGVADTRWRIVGLGDFDGDGANDIAWRHTTTGDNYVWYMNGVTQRAAAYLPAERDLNWEAAGVADFNRDGRADIVWRHRTNGQNRIWLLNNTTLTSSVGLVTLADTNWRIEGAGDMNRDGNMDIVWRHGGNGTNYVWFMSGTTNTSSGYLPGLADQSWDIESLADFNRDGSTDIVWRQATTGTNYIWFMNGTAQSGAAYLPGIADAAWKIAGPR